MSVIASCNINKWIKFIRRCLNAYKSGASQAYDGNRVLLSPTMAIGLDIRACKKKKICSSMGNQAGRMLQRNKNAERESSESITGFPSITKGAHCTTLHAAAIGQGSFILSFIREITAPDKDYCHQCCLLT